MWHCVHEQCIAIKCLKNDENVMHIWDEWVVSRHAFVPLLKLS